MKFLVKNKTEIIWLLLAVFGVGVIGYQAYQIHKLEEQSTSAHDQIRELQSEQQKTAEDLSDTVSVLNQNLALTKEEQNRLKNVLDFERERAKLREAQLQDISGTVGTLEKLKDTDPELLQKYSQVYFLNEHYEPTKLATIDEQYVEASKSDLQVHADVWPKLQELLEAADRADEELVILSAYRSFGTQAAIKNAYLVRYGEGANRFSADQGYSEHQLGTTVDFTTKENGQSLRIFDNTSQFEWLTKNAHRYGFTLSYPDGNEYYEYEPWHWRYVGRDLATRLFNDNKHFYDLEQRVLDEYLVNIFD